MVGKCRGYAAWQRLSLREESLPRRPPPATVQLREDLIPPRWTPTVRRWLRSDREQLRARPKADDEASVGLPEADNSPSADDGHESKGREMKMSEGTAIIEGLEELPRDLDEFVEDIVAFQAVCWEDEDGTQDAKVCAVLNRELYDKARALLTQPGTRLDWAEQVSSGDLALVLKNGGEIVAIRLTNSPTRDDETFMSRFDGFFWFVADDHEMLEDFDLFSVEFTGCTEDAE